MDREDTARTRLAIQRRLIFLVGFMSLAILIVGVYGLYGIWSSNKTLMKSLAVGERYREAIDAARMAQVSFKQQVQEWKNTLLRGRDAKVREECWAAFQREEREVKASLEQLKESLGGLKSDTADVDGALGAHRRLGEACRAALSKLDPRRPDGAQRVDREVRGADRAPAAAINLVVARVQKDARVRLAEIAEAAKAKAETDRRFEGVMQILIAAGILVGLILSISIIRKLGRLA